ncbi:MAG: putative glycoside hydrolase [Candidatus Peribacteraceae bacterium]
MSRHRHHLLSFGIALLVAVAVLVAKIQSPDIYSAFLSSGSQPSHKILFLWLGSQGRQFTSAELGQIANRTRLTFFSPFHNQGQITGILEDVWKLKVRAPDMKVIAYVNATIVPPVMQNEMMAEGFQDEWYLRAERGPQAGNVLTLGPSNPSKYVDTTNENYREWLMHFIEMKRYKAAPYDGVVFDSFNPYGVSIGSYDPDYWRGREYWLTHLTDAKIDALDESLPTLLDEAAEIDSDKVVGFNGISEKKFRLGDERRNLPYLDSPSVSFSLHEEFCAWDGAQDETVYATTDQIVDDLTIMKERSEDVRLLMQMNAVDAANPSSVDHVEDYCFGVFMAGYEENVRLGGGRYKVLTALQFWPRGINVDFGEPVGDFVYLKPTGLITREFTRGYVLVNTDTSPQTLIIPATGVIAGHIFNGTVDQIVSSGQQFRIPPRTAYFLNTTMRLAAPPSGF